ncbi:hypothetical protein DENSPDRAFT_785185 [Dentipellis sp. KUC8613]|nr:hypothetical protein DENSPDRAFT_785185 [Dentipellis sp. KUC8613]
MQALLKTEDFRQRIRAYIRQNVRAYLPGLGSEEEVKVVPNEPEIGYSRPPNPSAEDYEEQLAAYELRLARAKQIHTCEPRRCLVPDAHGRLRCKRGAPFDIADDDIIEEGGRVQPKRLYGYINGWMPAILINVRCNNDAKVLTNGRETKNITFYTTGYAAKKQNKTHNMSAIMAKGYAYHRKRSSYLDTIREDQQKMLFRLVHAINREQELAAPMVISYLMGWGDTYCSHRYTPIYFTSFMGSLLKVFPSLTKTG